jgi:hypothetical protein
MTLMMIMMDVIIIHFVSFNNNNDVDKYDFGDRPELLFKILPVANHIAPLRDIRTTSITDGKTRDYRETVIPLLP